MASSYMLSTRSATYIVKVSKTGRGRKTVVKREFRDYDEAMEYLDRMEALYGPDHVVEFDTNFG
jgi:hypothetical protein